VFFLLFGAGTDTSGTIFSITTSLGELLISSEGEVGSLFVVLFKSTLVSSFSSIEIFSLGYSLVSSDDVVAFFCCGRFLLLFFDRII